MRVLGLSAFYHDSAAALVCDGEIIAAAQEERFTRKKHDPNFPARATESCLKQAGITLNDIDLIAFYDKPLLKFERLLETYVAFAPRGFKSFSMAIPVWLREKLFLKNLLVSELAKLGGDKKDLESRLVFSEHHLSHAASAFFPSPFDEALVLTMDGVGEWATTSVALGNGQRLDVHKEIHFPHSLGLLYSAMTYYTGFKVNSGEYKVMGLAPYGEPRFADRIIDQLMDLKPDGSFRLDLSYFNYCTGLTMTNERFDALFGGPPRKPAERLTQRHMDLAASIQAVTEEVVLRLTRSLARTSGSANLCLAGGVALNCVANGKVLRDGAFKRLWVQPAAGDAGGALGAALVATHLHKGMPRAPLPSHQGDRMKGSFLGPAYAQSDIEDRLRSVGAVFEVLDDEALVQASAAALAEEKALGWFQAEWSSARARSEVARYWGRTLATHAVDA
jgi:carbamoyltransferase